MAPQENAAKRKNPKIHLGQAWWYMSIVPAPWKEEIRESWFKASLGKKKKKSKILFQKESAALSGSSL
jgi:hypothetical protein